MSIQAADAAREASAASMGLWERHELFCVKGCRVPGRGPCAMGRPILSRVFDAERVSVAWDAGRLRSRMTAITAQGRRCCAACRVDQADGTAMWLDRDGWLFCAKCSADDSETAYV